MSDKIHCIQFRKNYFNRASFAYSRNAAKQKEVSLFAASQTSAPGLLGGVF